MTFQKLIFKSEEIDLNMPLYKLKSNKLEVYIFFKLCLFHILLKIIKKIYADEPKPLDESFRQFEEIPEEEDLSTILMNEINACKYEVCLKI